MDSIHIGQMTACSKLFHPDILIVHQDKSHSHCRNGLETWTNFQLQIKSFIHYWYLKHYIQIWDYLHLILRRIASFL